MMQPRQTSNPFPGLRPFETDEYRLFFGREGQSDELLARLQRSHFLAVVGTSGSGKSSLIRAGLLPALRGGLMAGAGSGWRIAVMRPGGDPIGNFARELAKKDVLMQAGGGLPPAEAEAVIDATLRTGSLGLVDVARQGRLAEHDKLLIVVDQFEELFRFRSAAQESMSTGDEASAFVKLLLEAAQQRELAIYVVLTMRSDFLGDCSQFQGLPEAINDGQYLIPRMTRDERRFAVTGPVGVTRGKITEPLVSRLLNDVGDNPDQLPILQHALMRTWDHWASHCRNGEPIDLEHYEAIGTMSAALSLHADEAFNELPNDRSRLIAERLFKALSERGADNREIRRPTRLKAICEIAGANMAEVIAVIEVFRGGGRSFLMPPAGVALEPDTVIDISHESLIRNWQRLKDWVIEEAQSARIYRRLAEAAGLHREGSEGLLQDPALQIALDWREQSQPNDAWGKRYHREFETAIAYLEDSRSAREAEIAAKELRRVEGIERDRRELEMTRDFAEKQGRAASRLRWLAIGMGVMFLLALATAGFAMTQRRQALENSRIAVEERIKANEEKIRAEKQSEALRDALAVKEKAEKRRESAEMQRVEAERQQKLAEEAEDAALARALSEAKRANDALAKAKQEVINDHNNRDALASFQRGNVDEAEDKLAKLVPVYRGDAQRQAWVYSYLGAAQRRLGKLDEGIKNLKTAQAMQRAVLKKGDAEYLDTITWLGHAHSDKGDYELAQPLFADALEIRRSVSKHADIAVSLEYLARNQNNLGDAEEAAKTYDEALSFRRRNPNSPDLIAALTEVAEFYREHGELGTAIKFYEETLSNQEAYLEPYDPNIADTFNGLAEVYEETPYKGRAKVYNDLAKEIRRSGLSRRDSAGGSMETLANVYTAAGKYKQAAKLRVRAQEIHAQQQGAESRGPVNSLIDLGDFFRDAAKSAPEAPDRKIFYEKATATFGQALEISERKTYPLEEGRALDRIAHLHLEHKNFAEAERLYKRVLEMRERKLTSQVFAEKEMLDNLKGLAGSAVGLRKYTEAEAYLLRALKFFDGMDRSSLLLSNIDLPLLRHSMTARLAEVYATQGRFKEAHELYGPLAEQLKKGVNTNSRSNVENYLYITETAGRFYSERGDTAAAESFYRLVWPQEIRPTVSTFVNWPEAYSKSLMETAPISCAGDIIRILESYSNLLTKTGRTHEETMLSHGIGRMRERLMMEGLGVESLP